MDVIVWRYPGVGDGEFPVVSIGEGFAGEKVVTFIEMLDNETPVYHVVTDSSVSS
jgi:hypothetical protein